mgnify:CR=1 FL=1
MALPREESVYRHVVELTGHERLDDELGLFGHSVGPRFDAQTGRSRMRARGGEGEDWCLRRLLIGLAASNRLRMPASLQVTDEAHASKHALPNAVLVQPDEETVGIEVAAATLEADVGGPSRPPERSDADIASRITAGGYSADFSEQEAAAHFSKECQRKLNRLRTSYEGVGAVDALVYCGGQVVALLELKNSDSLISKLNREVLNFPQFRQIHILLDDTIILDATGNYREVVSLYGRYEHDFNQWCFMQAEAARQGDLSRLDLDNIAEELNSLGASDRRALESQIERVLEHLLKWTYQPEKRSRSWLKSVHDARSKIDRMLRDSPSLRREELIETLVKSSYPRAANGAALETGLNRDVFPASCPFTVQQIFSDDFPPEDEWREVTQ